MSRIEKIIDEIEGYVEECKPYPLSSSKIVVNKEELTELLEELRFHIPEEVSKYQKIISNKEAIIEQARNQAQDMVDKANELQSQMVDEHEIMQKAYANADKIIENAKQQAQAMIEQATDETNTMKRSVMKYSDEQLAGLETIVGHIMESSRQKFDSYYAALETNYGIIRNNRDELAEANSDK